MLSVLHTYVQMSSIRHEQKSDTPLSSPVSSFFFLFFLSRLSFAAKWHGLPPPLRLHHLPFQCKLDKHYLLTPFALRKAIKKLNCGKETRQLISSFRDEKYIFFLPPPPPPNGFFRYTRSVSAIDSSCKPSSKVLEFMERELHRRLILRLSSQGYLPF